MKLDSSSARYGKVNGKNFLMLDDNTGKTYARVCEVLPTLLDPLSTAERDRIAAMHPTFVDVDGDFRGYYVPVPDLESAQKQMIPATV